MREVIKGPWQVGLWDECVGKVVGCKEECRLVW